jgi:hypothetical protein
MAKKETSEALQSNSPTTQVPGAAPGGSPRHDNNVQATSQTQSSGRALQSLIVLIRIDSQKQRRLPRSK